MTLLEKFQQLQPQQKWIAIGVSVIAVFFMLGIISFWIAFNAIMYRVDAEQKAISKRQLEIKAQADNMQKQMNEQAKAFQEGAKQTTSEMASAVNNITKSANNAINHPYDIANFESLDKVSDDMFENMHITSQEDKIRLDDSTDKRDIFSRDGKNKNYNPNKSLQLDPYEQKIIKAIIADYRQKHPEITEKPGEPAVLKLSLADRIALLEIIRTFNDKRTQRDFEASQRPSQEMASDIKESFIQSTNDFNKNYKEGLEQWQKNVDEISKGFNNTDKPTSPSP